MTNQEEQSRREKELAALRGLVLTEMTRRGYEVDGEKVSVRGQATPVATMQPNRDLSAQDVHCTNGRNFHGAALYNEHGFLVGHDRGNARDALVDRIIEALTWTDP